MNLVREQHIMWTQILLISIAESLNDLEETQARLLKNSKDIDGIFKVFYGNMITDNIQKLLTENLVIAKELIIALKNKNEEQAKRLNNRWYQNADNMAELFSSINLFYPKEEDRFIHIYS